MWDSVYIYFVERLFSGGLIYNINLNFVFKNVEEKGNASYLKRQSSQNIFRSWYFNKYCFIIFIFKFNFIWITFFIALVFVGLVLKTRGICPKKRQDILKSRDKVWSAKKCWSWLFCCFKEHFEYILHSYLAGGEEGYFLMEIVKLQTSVLKTLSNLFSDAIKIQYNQNWNKQW